MRASHQTLSGSCVISGPEVPNPAAGLVTLLSARAFGADRIVVVDLQRKNLDMASSLGADAVVLSEKGATPEEVGAQIRAALGGGRPEVVIDCAGFEATMQVIHIFTIPGFPVPEPIALLQMLCFSKMCRTGTWAAAEGRCNTCVCTVFAMIFLLCAWI